MGASNPFHATQRLTSIWSATSNAIWVWMANSTMLNSRLNVACITDRCAGLLKCPFGTIAFLGFWSLALLVAGLPSSAQEARPGRVEFSDGRTLSGRMSLTPGSELKLHLGNQVRTVPLGIVQELRMSPERESIEQSYRFPEAGKAIKQTEGRPYPVRYLNTTVVLAGGETLTGHLYTTVLYVEGEGGDAAQKVILLAKQRGKEGETLKDLAYPARISFEDPAKRTEATVRLKFDLPGMGPGGELAALTRGALVRIEGKRASAVGDYTIPASLGKELFLALKIGPRIVVGWPKGTDEKRAALVRAALPESEDFFDDRRLLGVFHDEARSEVYSLMLASRKGATTLPETRGQPWRLEVYRWKLDPDSQRLMLAGKGYLFRGIGAKNEPVPTVELSDILWRAGKQATADANR